jgi:hypothetical protein
MLTDWTLSEVVEIEQENNKQLLDQIRDNVAECKSKKLGKPKLIILDTPILNFN